MNNKYTVYNKIIYNVKPLINIFNLLYANESTTSFKSRNKVNNQLINKHKF